MSRTGSAVLLVLGLGALILLPLFVSPNLTNATIKMMIAALFALAFALAMGQGGMLSFGHAAYYGLGAFAALHLMHAVEMKLFFFPTPLVPLVGGAAGALSGMVFGWLASQRTGVYFAMLTFALAELLFTVAPGLNAVFGAESGISTMRAPSWGLSFGPDSHVYYLTLAWFVISVWCMWAFTKTPLGRLALALRAHLINRRGLSRSFQITNVFPRMSVAENLRISVMGRHGHRLTLFRPVAGLRAVNAEVDEFLERLRLVRRRDNLAGDLAYSEQRILEMGMALAADPSVLILDEPTAGMSREETAYIVDIIRQVTESRTLLVVEHDMSVVFALADQVSVLVYGEVIATGDPAAVRADKKVQEAYLGEEVDR